MVLDPLRRKVKVGIRLEGPGGNDALHRLEFLGALHCGYGVWRTGVIFCGKVKLSHSNSLITLGNNRFSSDD
jgi:hypothetical protein